MQALTSYSLGYTNCAQNGGNINSISTTIMPGLISNLISILPQNPNVTVTKAHANIHSKVMVILFWIDDRSEFWLSDAQKRARHELYETKLRFVVQSVLNTGAYMAMAGPVVTPWYDFKDDMVRNYQRINIEVANEFEMEYIDVRGAFLESINNGRSPTRFNDNEHPNNHGANIIANLFMSSVNKWINITTGKSTNPDR
eukprot:gene9516-19773_t